MRRQELTRALLLLLAAGIVPFRASRVDEKPYLFSLRELAPKLEMYIDTPVQEVVAGRRFRQMSELRRPVVFLRDKR